jgi:hypothetical protein
MEFKVDLVEAHASARTDRIDRAGASAWRSAQRSERMGELYELHCGKSPFVLPYDKLLGLQPPTVIAPSQERIAAVLMRKEGQFAQNSSKYSEKPANFSHTPLTSEASTAPC